MNVERLRDTLQALKENLDEANLLNYLGQIQSSLQNEVTNPGNTQAQLQVADGFAKLRQTLSESRAEEFGPVWQQTIKDLNLGQLLPDSLDKEIERILQDNQLTPAAALKQIKDLRSRVESSEQAISRLLAALDALGINGAGIPRGKGEVGMIIPRTAISNRLDEFGVEAKGLSYWLAILSETATGEQEQATIESVSSSELIVYVFLSSVAVRVVAKALKDIATAYKTSQEGREIGSRLREIGMTDTEAAPLKAFFTKQMRKQITKTAKELLKEYPGQDERRKNELRNALPRVLEDIAQRFDAGYTFDVAVGDDSTDDDETPDENAVAILNARKILKYMEPSGERILELGPGGPDEDDTQEEQPPKKTPPGPVRRRTKLGIDDIGDA
jgi:hypothetical protein